jgi:ELWxxDGT repeat protein
MCAGCGTGHPYAYLWRTDGTAAGTFIIPVQGQNSSYPSSLTVAGPALFFIAATPARGNELYRTDGTIAGTALVQEIGFGEQRGRAPCPAG